MIKARFRKLNQSEITNFSKGKFQFKCPERDLM